MSISTFLCVGVWFIFLPIIMFIGAIVGTFAFVCMWVNFGISCWKE